MPTAATRQTISTFHQHRNTIAAHKPEYDGLTAILHVLDTAVFDRRLDIADAVALLAEKLVPRVRATAAQSTGAYMGDTTVDDITQNIFVELLPDSQKFPWGTDQTAKLPAMVNQAITYASGDSKRNNNPFDRRVSTLRTEVETSTGKPWGTLDRHTQIREALAARNRANVLQPRTDTWVEDTCDMITRASHGPIRLDQPNLSGEPDNDGEPFPATSGLGADDEAFQPALTRGVLRLGDVYREIRDTASKPISDAEAIHLALRSNEIQWWQQHPAQWAQIVAAAKLIDPTIDPTIAA